MLDGTFRTEAAANSVFFFQSNRIQDLSFFFMKAATTSTTSIEDESSSEATTGLLFGKLVIPRSPCDPECERRPQRRSLCIHIIMGSHNSMRVVLQEQTKAYCSSHPPCPPGIQVNAHWNKNCLLSTLCLAQFKLLHAFLFFFKSAIKYRVQCANVTSRRQL